MIDDSGQRAPGSFAATLLIAAALGCAGSHADAQCQIVQPPTKFDPPSAGLPTYFYNYAPSLSIAGAAGTPRLAVRYNYGFLVYSLASPGSPSVTSIEDLLGQYRYPKSGDGQSRTGPLAISSDGARALIPWTDPGFGTIALSPIASGFSGGGDFAPEGSRVNSTAVARVGTRYLGFSAASNSPSADAALYAADLTSLPTGVLGTAPKNSILAEAVPGITFGSAVRVLRVAESPARTWVVAATLTQVTVVNVTAVGARVPGLTSGFSARSYSLAELGLSSGQLRSMSAAVHPADASLHILVEAAVVDGATYTSTGVTLTRINSLTGAAVILSTYLPPAGARQVQPESVLLPFGADLAAVFFEGRDTGGLDVHLHSSATFSQNLASGQSLGNVNSVSSLAGIRASSGVYYLYLGQTGVGTFAASIACSSSCSLSCSATATTNALQGVPASFSATASPSGCSGAVSYAWDFGDPASGSANTSSSQSPSHTYASAGTYSWSMTATASGMSCYKSGIVTVGGESPPSNVIPSHVPANPSCYPMIHVDLSGISGSPSAVEFRRNGTVDTTLIARSLFRNPATGYLDVAMSVGANAAPGTRDVVVRGGSSVLATLPAALTVTEDRPAASPDKYHGPYVWTGIFANVYSNIIQKGDAAIDEFVSNLDASGFRSVFLFVDPGDVSANSARFERLLSRAHSAGLQVHAYIFNFQGGGTTEAAVAKLVADGLASSRAILAWNRQRAQNVRFDGIHLNIEPQGSLQEKVNLQTVRLLAQLGAERGADPYVLSVSPNSSAAGSARGTNGVDYCTWTQFADLFIPQLYLVDQGLRGIGDPACDGLHLPPSDKSFAVPCSTDVKTTTAAAKALDAGGSRDTSPDSSAVSVLGVSFYDRMVIYRPGAVRLKSDYWRSSSSHLFNCSAAGAPSPCEKNPTRSELAARVADGYLAAPVVANHPNGLTVRRYDVLRSFRVDFYNEGGSVSGQFEDLQPGQSILLVETAAVLPAATAAGGKYAAWRWERVADGSTQYTGDLAAGTPTVVTPGPQSFWARVRALLGFFVPGGLRQQSTVSCTVDVVARAYDGTELARKTVNAQGSQVVDLGLLPPDGWRFELISTCSVGVSVGVYGLPEASAGGINTLRFVPIVLDVNTGTAHYTTELSIANQGHTLTKATYTYTPALGTRSGGGTASEMIGPGQQRSIPDVVGYLRALGLPVPDSVGADAQQGGTLVVAFEGAESANSVSVTARTSAATAAPQPVGSAGLAYAGATIEDPRTTMTVYGLRQDAADRSNLAVYNTSSSPVTLRVTAYSGDATAYSRVIRDAETLPPFGWVQYSRVFENTGITQGWVVVEKTGGTGSFDAYGVINDHGTSDGSFVLPVGGTVGGSRITVPVLVETAAFRSELVLANRGATTATLTLRYTESQTPSMGAGGAVVATLRPKEQLIIPEAVDWLRMRGISIGTRETASYVGALRISVAGAALSDVYAGARTASRSPAGGQFGLFTPGFYEGQEASSEASLFGLLADANNRANIAVLNAGPDGPGDVTLEVRTFDGDVGGAERGTPEQVTLGPGQWKQYTNLLKSKDVANGWVHVKRLSGSAPWITYGVVNDGGNPGERTGDGAYVPMTTRAGSVAGAVSIGVTNSATGASVCAGSSCSSSVGTGLRFTALVNGATDPAPPAGLSWSFGDGASAAGQNALHSYFSAGSYAVTLAGYTQPASVIVNVESGAGGGGGGGGGGGTVIDFTIQDAASGTGLAKTGETFWANAGQRLRFLAYGTTGSVSWSFGDGETSTETSPVKTYGPAVDTTYVVRLTNEGRIKQVNLRVGGLTGAPLTGDFAYVYADGSAVSRTAVEPNKAIRFTGVDQATTYLWDFGDGTALTGGSPKEHTFTRGGTFTVRLTVARDGVSGTVTTAVPPDFVVKPPPDPLLWVAPGMAYADGGNGERWQSDLSIFNPGTRTATLALGYVSGAGWDGATKVTWLPQVLVAGETKAFPNVLESLFRLAKGAWGVILVRGDDIPLAPVILSRTYNAAGADSVGTLGLSVPAMSVAAGVKPDSAAGGNYLAGLRHDEMFRTNLTVANLKDDTAEVEVVFRGASGAVLGTPARIIVEARGVKQLNAALSSDPPHAADQAGGAGWATPTPLFSAEIQIKRGSGVYPYATVIDQGTGDSIVVTPVPHPSSSYRLPAIVRSGQFTSDVSLLNPSAKERKVRLEYSYVKKGEAERTTKSKTVTLQSFEMKGWVDFFGSILDLPAGDTSEYSASLIDIAPAADDAYRTDPFVVAGKTYWTSSLGSVGMNVNPFVAEDGVGALASGKRIVLSGLESNARFRTNIALFINPGATSSDSVEADVHVFDSRGRELRSIWVRLDLDHPLTQLASDNLFADLVTTETERASIIISNPRGAARLGAYATIIDNLSQDLTFVGGHLVP